MQSLVTMTPLTREMWQHRFSHYTRNEIEEGIRSRQTCVGGTRLLEGPRTNLLNELKGSRIAGLQREGVPMNALMADQGLEHWIFSAQINNPIRHALDFRPSGELRGNFELGSDANDFLASEYGIQLQADPYRDPRHVMIDSIREKQHPEEAFSRQDLANRYFLTAGTQAQSLQNERGAPEEIRNFHAKRARHTYNRASTEHFKSNSAQAAAANYDDDQAVEYERLYQDRGEDDYPVQFRTNPMNEDDRFSHDSRVEGIRSRNHADAVRPDHASVTHNFYNPLRSSVALAAPASPEATYNREERSLTHSSSSTRSGNLDRMEHRSFHDGAGPGASSKFFHTPERANILADLLNTTVSSLSPGGSHEKIRNRPSPQSLSSSLSSGDSSSDSRKIGQAIADTYRREVAAMKYKNQLKEDSPQTMPNSPPDKPELVRRTRQKPKRFTFSGKKEGRGPLRTGK
jgi:hypothetical protein